jgi:hypothetical protein
MVVDWLDFDRITQSVLSADYADSTDYFIRTVAISGCGEAAVVGGCVAGRVRLAGLVHCALD